MRIALPPVFESRGFRILFTAQLVSVVGDFLVPVALAFAVLDLTGSASALGLVLLARIRSHGLSTPRRTALSKTPPPETSSTPNPASSRIPASRRTAAVGIRPASGSCPSSRIVVSPSWGTAGP